jgi:hypothetical protein
MVFQAGGGRCEFVVVVEEVGGAVGNQWLWLYMGLRVIVTYLERTDYSSPCPFFPSPAGVFVQYHQPLIRPIPRSGRTGQQGPVARLNLRSE